MNSAIHHIIKAIHSRIDETRRAFYREELYRGMITAFSLLVLTWAVLLSIESYAHFGIPARTILFYSFWIVTIAGLVRFTGKPLLRTFHILPQATDEEIARIIGSKFEKIGDRLENALDLSRMVERNEAAYSAELVEVSLEHFQKSTSGVQFSDAVSFETVRRNGRILSAVSIVIAVIMLFPSSPFSSAAVRIWNHGIEYIVPPPFTFIVDPGDAEVIKGESILVRARLRPEAAGVNFVLPEEITLSSAETGVSQEDHIAVRKDSSGSFHFLFAGVKNSLRYHFSAGDVRSPDFGITVLDRPFLRSMNVTITPPSYTKLTRQTLDQNNGDIVALPGSRIEWTISASNTLKDAFIEFTKDRKIKFVTVDNSYHAWYTTRASGPYWISLEDTNGVTNSDAIQYRITIIPDDYPTVNIIMPGQNVDVTKAMQLPMEFKVNDDFGITQLKLAFRLVQSKYSKPEEHYGIILPFDTIKTTNGILPYDWDISVMGLVPEDVVEYYAEVTDNDDVHGPKTGRSKTYLIRLPSLEEVFSDADQLHDNATKDLEQSLQQAEALKQEIEKLSNDMKRNQQVDWQKQNKSEEIAQKFQNIQKQIDDVNKKMDAMTQTLQRNNILSPETLEKYAELQKLMQNLNSPEFQDALKKMQQAMQNISPDQLRQAMQQMQFSEEQFRSTIERSINLLKRIQIEQKVDELVKRAAEMQKEQEAVQKATEQMKENDISKASELSRRQKDIENQLPGLQKAMDELREKMDEFQKEMPMEKLSDAQEAARDKEMTDAMQQSADQLRSMQLENAMTAQQQASSKMKSLSQQISELQEQLLNNQMQQTMTALRKAMQDMLQLSQKQEQLKNSSRNLDPNSQQFRDIGQQQQSLQGDLGNITNGLAELSQKSFVVTPEMGKSIGQAMAYMQQAMNGIEQRNGSSASGSQGQAMAFLNKSATMIQSAMQSLQQSGGQGGGSLMQQLQNLSMQQQGINMATQQLGEQPGGLSQQQMQEMGRLARQQEEVRKSLEQLQKEAQAKPDKNRVLGDLQKISDDMKEVVEQLKQNDANPNTIRQQERILSRLLQAQHSTRERDYEEKRQATSGKTIIRNSPAEITLQSKESRIQRDLERAMEAGYSKDYMDLIRKYYDALNKAE